MSEPTSNISVQILDKEYQIACPEGEEQSLLESARLLNSKMTEIRQSGKIIGIERIAVMTALNLSNELISANKEIKKSTEQTKKRLQTLTEKVEQALALQP
ncbi:MAG: cell division protein ZapA [Gammaproteobacteria bacterium]|nr:MAG: cell division protein ZapA [Gammaproteobacteria bacterium]